MRPVLVDLDAIADYIVLGSGCLNMSASGRAPAERSKSRRVRGVWRYRQIVEPPCRIIYQHEKRRVHVVHVIRGERLLDKPVLRARDNPSSIDT